MTRVIALPPPVTLAGREAAASRLLGIIDDLIEVMAEENAAIRAQDISTIDALTARKLEVSAELQRQRPTMQQVLDGGDASTGPARLVADRLLRLRDITRENCSLLNASKVVTHMRIEAVMEARRRANAETGGYDRSGGHAAADDRGATRDFRL